MKWLKNLGPGLLVTAAFIGPGTIITANKAGADFGFALLWALVFSVFATIVLQEMCARLGLVTGQGLGESIRTASRNPAVRAITVVFVVGSIAFGNAAFQTGNILGAAAGLEALTSTAPQIWTLMVGAGAFLLLACGAYRVLERALVVLVAVMSVVFLLTAIIVQPSVGQMFAGFIPSISGNPPGALITIIALIGTTVVPYNLFLHSSAVREKWPASVPVDTALRQARLDTFLSIPLGGMITLAVMATAAAAFFGRALTFDTPAELAKQLEPLLGPAAKYFFATGLLAAGLTSAITAPLAAAYATTGVLGWERNLRSWKFRIVWAVIVVAGTAGACFLGTSPVQTIVFAQAANGILLPLIAIFLLAVMNQGKLLGKHKNGVVANLLGAVVVLTATGLGVFQLLQAVGAV